MPTDREQILIGALDINDGENFDMESLIFTPTQKKPAWVSSNDADGDALARESHYTPAYFEMEIRVAHQVDTAAALAKLGELTDAVQGCEREEGGRPIPWTPNTTETTYTAYALSGDITDMPTVVAGDDAGWFIECPKVKVKLTCRPFLERPERVVLEAVESGAEPLQEVFIGEIGGDVPAKARLILTDEAGEDRRYAAFGQDLVDDEAPPALLITAADLTTEGFSGESKTRSGAYPAEGVIRATAISQPTTIATTGRIEHVGSFEVLLRVFAEEGDRFRISYRSGDGPLIPLRWKTPPVFGNFAEISMGEVFLDAVELGEQTSEIRIEVVRPSGAADAEVNYLFLWPTRRAAYARGLASNSSTKLLAYDNFLQPEGVLSGKPLPVGGAWSGAGDLEDFTVIAAEDYARRTKVSDADLNSGRFALAGSTDYTTFRQQLACRSGTGIRSGASRVGLLGRYGSTEKWVMAVLTTVPNPADDTQQTLGLAVIMNASGAVSTLDQVALTGLSFTQTEGLFTLAEDLTIELSVTAAGTWSAACGNDSLSGQHSTLATGGTLATGKVGVYDAMTSASVASRFVDTYLLLGADEPGCVCYSARKIEFNHRGVLRQDETGTYDGPPDFARGANFYLEPEGDNGTINRVVARMRRNDVKAEADPTVTDKHKLEALATEQFLAPR